MSTPFTDPLSETASFQQLAGEIALAWWERLQAIQYDKYYSDIEPRDDRDIQRRWFWANLQTWVEFYSPAFINHVNGPLNADNTEPLLFTLGTFRAAAGLHPDGFRRATEWDGVNDPEWQYGIMQPGDVIGPWIIEDLQKALSALRWDHANRITDTWSHHVRRVGGIVTYEYGPTNDFSSGGVSASDGTYLIWYEGSMYGNVSALYRIDGVVSNMSRKWSFYNHQTVGSLNGVLDLYLKGSQFGFPARGELQDLDGLNFGFNVYNKMPTHDLDGSVAQLGGTTMFQSGTDRYYYCEPLFVRKIDFTNQNPDPEE